MAFDKARHQCSAFGLDHDGAVYCKALRFSCNGFDSAALNQHVTGKGICTAAVPNACAREIELVSYHHLHVVCWRRPIWSAT